MATTYKLEILVVEKSNISELALRTKIINTLPNANGQSVIYVMSRDQRITDNFGLAYAQDYALRHKLPLAVVFCFSPVKGRAREHVVFMIEGLREIETTLAKLAIPFIALFGPHDVVLRNIAHHTKPALMVTDYSPLRGTLRWQNVLSQTVPLCIVDSHNIVPPWLVSNKQEYSARTIRPKIYSHYNDFIHHHSTIKKHPYRWPGAVMNLKEVAENLTLYINQHTPNNTHSGFTAGETAAQQHLQHFIDTKLHGYAYSRNDPSKQHTSDLSPYLHFGQIGSVSVMNAVSAAVVANAALQNDADALQEELVIRKELADNYCNYNQDYTTLRGAPEWSRRTLQKHETDPRNYIYSLQELETANTHDLAWNAAQRQLTATGKMHGYMRMYWAKKVLEWSKSAQEAQQKLIYLNDFYSIDGGDPNGYVGILWSIAGLHDRPWGERPVYGTVRSMVYNGLKRKFDIEAYIQKYET